MKAGSKAADVFVLPLSGGANQVKNTIAADAVMITDVERIRIFDPSLRWAVCAARDTVQAYAVLVAGKVTSAREENVDTAATIEGTWLSFRA